MFSSGASASPRAPRRPPRPRLATTPGAGGGTSAPLSPRPRPPHGKILRWSIGASIAVHLLILLLSPLWLRVGLPPGSAVEDVDRFARREIQLIEPVIRADAPLGPAAAELERLPVAPTATLPPRPATVPRAGAPDAARPPAASPDAARPGAAPPARDGLRPGVRDPRLYVNPREIAPPEQSDRQRYQAHIQARVDAINDSMAIAAAENRRTRDWTFEDGEGRRWGIGEGGSVHLGGIRIPPGVLPVPGATGDNQSLERQREIERQREEIRRQEEARDRRREPRGGQD
jgi:hypothetical protein